MRKTATYRRISSRMNRHRLSAGSCLGVAVCVALVAYIYIHAPGFIRPSEFDPQNNDAATMGSLSFSVLTLNVWFGSLEFDRRMAGIVDLLVEKRADFVCLQEVTPRAAEMFKKDARLKEMYDVNKHSVGRYGVLLLVQKHWHAKFHENEFPTNMGRVLLSATVETKLKGQQETKEMVVSTVHLESLNNHPIREEQMGIANKAQLDFENAILCGDFNFCSYRNFDESKPVLENDSLKKKLPGYLDLWSLLHDSSKEKGYTFDSETNMNIRKFERMRYDRMMTKLKDFKPVRIDVIAKKPVATEEGSVHLSDHYGLLAVFEHIH